MTEAQHQTTLDRARQGDSRALTALFEGFRPYIHILARGRPRRKRPEFAGTVALVDTSAFYDEPAHALFLKGFDMAKNRWRDEEAKKRFELMGSKPEYLYLGSGKTFALIGHGFAEAMKGLWSRNPTVTKR